MFSFILSSLIALTLFLSTAYADKPVDWTTQAMGFQPNSVSVTKDGILVAGGNSSYQTSRNQPVVQPNGTRISKDGGRTWVAAPGVTATGMTTVFGHPSGDVLLMSFGTGGGLHTYDGVNASKAVSSLQLTVIGTTPSGNIITQHDQSIYIGKGRKWEYVNLGANATSTGVCEDNQMCFGTDKGIFVVDEKEGKPQLLQKSPTAVAHLFDAGKGQLVALNTTGDILTSSGKLTEWKKETLANPVNFVYRGNGILLVAARNDSRLMRVTVADGKFSLKDLSFISRYPIAGAIEDSAGSLKIFQSDGNMLYQRVPVNLTLKAIGEGQISISNKASDSLFLVTGSLQIKRDFLIGDKVDLEAIPKDGFEFARWNGVECKQAACVIDIKSKDMEISAEFEKKR